MARAKQTEKQAIGSQNRTVTPNEAKLALKHCCLLYTSDAADDS